MEERVVQRKDAVVLDQETEADREGTKSYFFKKIGSPIPIKPSSSEFDLENPPSQPLAISEKFQLMFFGHSEGFCVAKSRDVIKLSQDMKENGKSSSIQDVNLVQVFIGRVHILALSADSSTLAACVGGQVYFFSVNSLLEKAKEPLFSCSLGDSINVKDFLWKKGVKSSYIILSREGLVYDGYVNGNLNKVMDGVDAVDCNMKGDFIVTAKQNVLSILTADFKEWCNMSLLFQPLNVDSESHCNIKVDAIKWVRDDSIIIGCIRLTEDGNEEGYLVQVITSIEDEIIKASSKPKVFSFSELFTMVVDDILPAGCGPYLFASYLECCELVLASNKKNLDSSGIAMLKWPYKGKDDKTKEVVNIELMDDRGLPRIELKDDGDDNLIFGFGIDEISIFEKVKYDDGTEIKMLTPFCILSCLASDGRLFMFHVVSCHNESKKAATADQQEKSSTLIHKGQGYLFGADKDQLHAKLFLTKEPGMDLPLTQSRTSLTLTSDRASQREEPKFVETEKNSQLLSGQYPFKGQPFREIQEIPRSSPPLPSHPEIPRQFSSVNNLIKELDTLLLHIEQKGGFIDACTAVQKHSVLSLEKGLEDLSKRCRKWNVSLQDQMEEIRHLLDKNMQVSARSLYVKGLMEQASDKRYWKVWNEQKLNPEFEMKRQKLLERNQNLMNQIIELERHFNTLELNRFGGYSGSLESRQRATRSSLESQRPIHSLSSLYNTANSQLAVAEKLSECLSCHIKGLHIEPERSNQKSVMKDLFESIGLVYNSDQFQSPYGKVECTPDSVKKLSSSDETRIYRSGSNYMKSTEPESARRRRDSLDNSFTSFKPSKTTVKRSVLPEQPSDFLNKESSPLSPAKERIYFQVDRSQVTRYPVVKDIGKTPLDKGFSSPPFSPFKWAEGQAEQSQLIESAVIDSPLVESNNLPPLSYRSSTQLPSTSVSSDMSMLVWGQRLNLESTSLKQSKSFPFQSISNSRSYSGVQCDFSAVKQEPTIFPSISEPIKPSSVPTISKSRSSPSTQSDFSTVTEAPSVLSTSSSQSTSTSESYFSVQSDLSTIKKAPSMHVITCEPTKPGSDQSIVNSKPSFLMQSVSTTKEVVSTSPFTSETVKISSPKESTISDTQANQHSSTSSATDSLNPTVRTAKTGDVTLDHSFSLPDLSQTISSPSFFTTSPANLSEKISQRERPESKLYPSETKANASTRVSSPKLSSSSTSVSVTTFPIKASSSPLFSASTSSSTTSSFSSHISMPVPHSSSSSSVTFGGQLSNSKIGEESDQKEFSLPSLFHLQTETQTPLQPSQNTDAQPPQEELIRKPIVSTSSQNKLLESTPNPFLVPSTTITFPVFSSTSHSEMSFSSSVKNQTSELPLSQEDDMEEEVPETKMEMSLSALGGFGLGSTPVINAPISNPFGGSFLSPSISPSSTPSYPLKVPSNELFRPASFDFPSIQPAQAPSSTFSTPSGTGFGQPSQIGAGQQALGSALGTFGQSRQLGSGLSAFGMASSGGFGGVFSNTPSSGGGFAGAASGGGFAGAASSGGFAGAASGGGFAGAASSGGFAGAASGGGFAGAASSGGFAGAASGGGFGAFSNKPEVTGFKAFGNTYQMTSGKPQELFTQMRK